MRPLTPSRVVGLVGAALLVLGVFTPVVTGRSRGDLTYFGYSPVDGVLMLALACAAALLCISPHRWALWVPGLAALVTIGDSLYDTTIRLAAQRTDALGDLIGAPLAGLIEGATHTDCWGSGWVVLLAGGVLVIVAASISEDSRPRMDTRQRA